MNKKSTIIILMLVIIGMLSGCTERTVEDFPSTSGTIEGIERFQRPDKGWDANDCRVIFKSGRIFEFRYTADNIWGDHSDKYWYNYLAMNEDTFVIIYYHFDADIGIEYNTIFEVK